MASTSQYASQLNSAVNSLQSDVTAQAQKVDVALNAIDKTVNNVAQRIRDLRETIIKFEEKSIAQENILRIEQQINEQLKDYMRVRKSVLGVIKDFDFNLTRNTTINELSQEVWLSTSGYWLSYAFIALSVWLLDGRKDDSGASAGESDKKHAKEVCYNALSEAMRKDASKTSLFFCLFNMRIGRHLEAREWLHEYFGSVDSMHPPRETALIIRAYLYGVFGHDSQLDSFVQTTINHWMETLQTDTEISGQLVENYNKYIANLPTSKTDFSNDVLDEHCDTVKEMQDSLLEVSRFKSAFTRISALDKVPEPGCNSDFIKSIDKLLEDLVNNYDAEELRLNNEKKLYELIKEHNGDVEAAKKEFLSYSETVKEAPNIGQQMFLWAVYPNGLDASIQKFAMQKTKDWYMRAVNTYAHDAKSKAPGAFKLHIEFWEDTTDGKDREAVKKSLDDKYVSERSKLLLYTKQNIIMSVVALVCLLVGCIVGFAAGEADWNWYGYLAGGGLFVVFALIIVLTTVVRYKKYPARIARAEETLDACFDGIEAYRDAFDKATSVKDEVLKKLEYI